MQYQCGLRSNSFESGCYSRESREIILTVSNTPNLNHSVTLVINLITFPLPPRTEDLFCYFTRLSNGAKVIVSEGVNYFVCNNKALVLKRMVARKTVAKLTKRVKVTHKSPRFLVWNHQVCRVELQRRK